MLKALIYKPTKTAMQSGKANTKEWIFSIVPTKPQRADPLIGWIGQGTTLNQLKLILKFPTKEQAINYAEKKGIQYEVRDPHKSILKKKSYADSFTKFL